MRSCKFKKCGTSFRSEVFSILTKRNGYKFSSFYGHWRVEFVLSLDGVRFFNLKHGRENQETKRARKVINFLCTNQEDKVELWGDGQGTSLALSQSHKTLLLWICRQTRRLWIEFVISKLIGLYGLHSWLAWRYAKHVA